ncbi:hypothetical protein [Corynebacterium antarcticum]|uniref:hypothetical protein n=1 Tax=Corynebacterium antarcticum TaxID=2800405 RepID=UPI0020056DA7|nr:hypothetical protein [Corynebacterium antarcticum]MCK7661987.1 hypothetical protein [Corynebacterium antarcticum]
MPRRIDRCDDNRDLVDAFLDDLAAEWRDHEPLDAHLAETYARKLRPALVALVHGYARMLRADCQHDRVMVAQYRRAVQTGEPMDLLDDYDVTEATR